MADGLPPAVLPDPSLLTVFRAVAQADDWFDGALMAAFPAPPPSDVNCVVHERHIPGPTVRHIAALLFTLAANRIVTGEALQEVIRGHNAHIDAMLADKEGLRRWGLTPQRFDNARFSRHAAQNAVANVEILKRLALDGTSFARFLAPQANRAAVFEALDVLCLAGALITIDGAYNSKIYISNGQLESLYAQYLARLRDDIRNGATE